MVQEGKFKWTRKCNDAWDYVCVCVIVCENTSKDELETIAKWKIAFIKHTVSSHSIAYICTLLCYISRIIWTIIHFHAIHKNMWGKFWIVDYQVMGILISLKFGILTPQKSSHFLDRIV